MSLVQVTASAVLGSAHRPVGRRADLLGGRPPALAVYFSVFLHSRGV
jgi:hypothetical protein